MSTTQDRLRGRLETLERVKAPDSLGVLVIPTGVQGRGPAGVESGARSEPAVHLYSGEGSAIMTIRRERLEKRLTELEQRSGTQGMRLVFCAATVSDADYPAWHRENAASIEGDDRWVFVVRFVEPKMLEADR